MAGDAFILTEADKRVLQAILDRERSAYNNAKNRPAVIEEDSQSSDIYVVQSPVDGIPAKDVFSLGVAECEVFQTVEGAVDEDTGLPTVSLVEAGFTLQICNMGGFVIPGEFVEVKREKYGQWLVSCPCPGGQTGTGTGTGGCPDRYVVGPDGHDWALVPCCAESIPQNLCARFSANDCCWPCPGTVQALPLHYTICSTWHGAYIADEFEIALVCQGDGKWYLESFTPGYPVHIYGPFTPTSCRPFSLTVPGVMIDFCAHAGLGLCSGICTVTIGELDENGLCLQDCTGTGSALTNCCSGNCGDPGRPLTLDFTVTAKVGCMTSLPDSGTLSCGGGADAVNWSVAISACGADTLLVGCLDGVLTCILEASGIVVNGFQANAELGYICDAGSFFATFNMDDGAGNSCTITVTGM